MKTILAFFLFTVFCSNALSQIYYNQEIKNICNNKAIKPIKSSIRDTLIEENIVKGNNNIAYHYIIRNSKVCHIGLKLFPDSVISVQGSIVYKFIERRLLFYTSIASSDSIISDLKLNNIFLALDGIKFGESGFTDFTKVILDLRYPANYQMYSDSAQIGVKFTYNNSKLRFAFKKNFNLLSGLNKIEADSELLNDLNNCANNSKRELSKMVNDTALLTKINDSVFNFKGNNYLHVLTGNYYIVRSGSFFKILFDSHYPVESFISSVIKGDASRQTISVILTHKQYKHDRKVALNLADLISYLGREHELYFGTEDTSSVLSGTLIAYNRNSNYIHLLYFKTNEKNLFSTHPEYSSKLYSYIPTDNIKDIYSVEDEVKGPKKQWKYAK